MTAPYPESPDIALPRPPAGPSASTESAQTKSLHGEVSDALGQVSESAASLDDSAAGADTHHAEPSPPLAQSQEQGRTIGSPSVDIRVGHNHGDIIGQWFEAVQRHSGAPLRKEWIARELKDYVPFGNEGEAIEKLRENRVLVLFSDRSGSGRWTAALHLLSDPKRELSTIRRVRRDPGTAFEMDGIRGHRSHGWILDLRDPEEDMSPKYDFGHELLQVDALRADNSFLIVLVSTKLWERVGIGADQLELKLLPPEPSKLFTTFLRSAGVAYPEEWAGKLATTIKELSSGDVRDWALTLSSSYHEYLANHGNAPSPGDEKIIQSARNAASGWMKELVEWNKVPRRTSYERNFLLLAAVYGGEPIEGIHAKIASLAGALGEKGEAAEPRPGQQGPGLIQITAEIENADLLPNGRLRFPGPGYAEAIVRYFWLDRPHLTDAFVRWTVQLSRELRRSPESRIAERIAERMTPWVLHQAKVANSTRLLRLVAEGWSEEENLAEHAHALLIAASLDPQIGSRVRRAMGAWISQDSATAALLRTLVHVFKTLAPAHEQMLARLGDLASSAHDDVAEAVGESIKNLWNNPNLHDSLRDTLISWFDEDQEAKRRAAVGTFLQLASGSTSTLIEERTNDIPDWVIRGWQVVLEADKLGPIHGTAFRAWLDSAASDTVLLDAAITTLVKAVHDSPTDHRRALRLLNLGRLEGQWRLDSVLGSQLRAEVSQELQRRLQLADPRRLIHSGEGGPAGA